MADPNPDPNAAAKAAMQSLTLRSAAAIAVAFVASKFSFVLPDAAAQDIAPALVDLVTTLGLVGVAVGRTRARGPLS